MAQIGLEIMHFDLFYIYRYWHPLDSTLPTFDNGCAEIFPDILNGVNWSINSQLCSAIYLLMAEHHLGAGVSSGHSDD